jgi:predicted DCC family thiol-disulfide oxidoreductase YuxK
MKAYVFFDSWCAMCHWAVRFTFKRDKQKQFVYAPLDGTTAKDKIADWVASHPNIDSIVLVEENGTISWYSKAVFRILWRLGFPWSIVGVLCFLPDWMLIPFDWLYREVAKRRSQSCDIATHVPQNEQFLP